MRKLSAKIEPTGYPEFAVRAETIGRFFAPPLASSTFYDFVKDGKIVPLKGIRGFYKLNDSLRRLGLREVPELPKAGSRTTEEIVRLAFHSIDPEVFPVPSWQLNVEVIDGMDAGHAELIYALHAEVVMGLATDRQKQHYLQGVLDAEVIKNSDGESDGKKD
jgi:hypothetical protein